MDSTQLFTFIFTSVVVILSPGPDLIYALITGLRANKRVIIYTCLGFALGNIIHLFFFLIGIGVLVKSNPQLARYIQYAGSAYLIYLGIKAFIHAKEPLLIGNENDTSERSHFKKAFIMNILNPKVIIFFMAFFPQFINTKPTSLDELTQLIILGTIFIALVFVIFSTLAFSISHIGMRLLQKSKIKTYFDYSVGILFIGLGLRIFFISL
tara:strand:+ start:26494 stop:27123 length:630 start_codon:yes stop_codon:yes gene_type:complete